MSHAVTPFRQLRIAQGRLCRAQRDLLAGRRRRRRKQGNQSRLRRIRRRRCVEFVPQAFGLSHRQQARRLDGVRRRLGQGRQRQLHLFGQPFHLIAPVGPRIEIQIELERVAHRLANDAQGVVGAFIRRNVADAELAELSRIAQRLVHRIVLENDQVVEQRFELSVVLLHASQRIMVKRLRHARGVVQ